MDAGKTEGIIVTGPSDIRRVEAGILGYGCDIGLDVNPFEAGMERLLDLDSKREFIGKAALLRIRELGPKRRIVGIEVFGEALEQGVFTERWPVIVGDQVGEVLIALHSPRLEKNIGYAMVSIDHTALDSPLSIKSPIGVLEAKVARLPFVSPIKT